MDKKTISKILNIASIVFVAAALILIVISLFTEGENVTTTISIACTSLSSMFIVIRNSIENKE